MLPLLSPVQPLLRPPPKLKNLSIELWPFARPVLPRATQRARSRAGKMIHDNLMSNILAAHTEEVNGRDHDLICKEPIPCNLH